jgi:tRNA pseudouridine13 synthase
VRGLCDALGIDARGCGWAGLKDRNALTRQWISLTGTTPEAVKRAEVEGVQVLEASAHTQKLRTGHLRGNHFLLRLRHVEAARLDDLRRVLSVIAASGLPNYYGEQRFGREGDNAERALRWVRGEARPPRPGFQRKLQMSALQSELFNRCVAARVRTSTLGEVFPGDVMKKHESGGVFISDDPQLDQARADAWEISPTGPLFGAKMRWPTGAARAREEALLSEAGLSLADFGRWKRVAPGTRRFVRVPVGEIGLSVSQSTVTLDFTLSAGSYATVLVREILKRDAPATKSG